MIRNVRLQALHFPKRYSELLSDQNLLSLLQSCTQTSEITQIHGLMVKTGLEQLSFPFSKLLASSIRDIHYAASIFKHAQNPNLFMFNTMLRCYSISSNHDPDEAFRLFNYMRVQNILLDQFSFISTLKVCARASAIWIGFGIHSLVLRSGFDLFVAVKNTLLHFYCVCGKIGVAQKLFDELLQRRDLVSWNTLMGGYLNASQPAVVIHLFRQLFKNLINVGITAMLSVLAAAGELGCLFRGQSLHGYCIKVGFCSDLNVATALISLYAKNKDIDNGQKVLDEIPVKDVVLWNCLVDGYAKNGELEKSLSLLKLMKLEGVKPNSSTLAGLLSVCAASGGLSEGKCIHNYVQEQKLSLDSILGTALVDMYSKGGLLENAIDIFAKIEEKDVKSWTAMISGYGLHGQAKKAIELFDKMEEEGIRPNEITFLAVLTACSHGGLVGEGMGFFERMVRDYRLKPEVEHYSCIIDLLGRAGMLEEAHGLIERLPVRGDATAWRALLAACRVYGNVNLGEHVMRNLEEMYDEHPADRIVLSSTYAISGRIADCKIGPDGNTAKQRIVTKETGISMIELHSK